jgi:hypothetical protein
MPWVNVFMISLFPRLPLSYIQFRASHQYAIATTDTAFKHMLSLSLGSNKSIVI